VTSVAIVAVSSFYPINSIPKTNPLSSIGGDYTLYGD
jgi:hypothetical protein